MCIFILGSILILLILSKEKRGANDVRYMVTSNLPIDTN